MSTVGKALSVLDLFSEGQPNLGLSEIARQLGWDKSNVRRYVSDLTGRGVLEQDSRDKSYYLGPALTRLAMVRERTHPIAGEVRAELGNLMVATGETAHASMFVGGQLVTIAIVETKIRGTRVYVDPAAPLPFHATGSGIAFLAGSTEARIAEILTEDPVSYTPDTPISIPEIRRRVETVRKTGIAKMSGSYESDVIGIAAPVMGFDGLAIGAVAVAAPMARFNDDVEIKIAATVTSAARRVSQLHGAR